MAERSTAVDFISLQEFHDRLTGRLADAQSLVSTLTNDLIDRNPKLGTFTDANTTTDAYWTRWRDQVARANRLLDAVQAAHTATGEILKTYQTTEALNGASAQDLAHRLEGVGTALNGDTPPPAPVTDGQHHGRGQDV
jgi:hypothetical protein